MPEVTDRGCADLWGAPFGEKRIVSEPLEDLQNQAEILTARTREHLIGEARERVRGETVWIGLWAKVPAMGDYEYKLITVSHPLTVADPRRPYPFKATDHVGATVSIADRTQWLDWLAGVLSSSGVHALVNRLLQLAADYAARPAPPTT